MVRWKANAHLIILASICMAAGIVVPFIPVSAGRDVLAGVAILGGLAMLIVALTQDKDEGGN